MVMCLLVPITTCWGAETVEEKAISFIGLLRDGEFDDAAGMCNETFLESFASSGGLGGF